MVKTVYRQRTTDNRHCPQFSSRSVSLVRVLCSVFCVLCSKKIATIFSRGDFFALGIELTAHCLLFLNKTFYNFTVFCLNFNKINAIAQVRNIN